MTGKGFTHGLSGWKLRCRCEVCTAAHREETRAYERKRNLIPDEVWDELVERVREGETVKEAAAACGASTVRVWSQARVYPERGARLFEALDEGRDPEVPHGTHRGYLWAQCRCTDCREWQRRRDPQ